MSKPARKPSLEQEARGRDLRSSFKSCIRDMSKLTDRLSEARQSLDECSAGDSPCPQES